MRSYKFTPLAERQLRDADDWWQIHRTAAPNAVLDDTESTIAMLLPEPAIGPLARDVELPDVRRVVMERIRYYLYYRFDDVTVEILALWHTSRGSPPLLQ